MNKRSKVDDVWLRVQNVVLRLSDKAVLLSEELNDKVINAAQKLLHQKFPSLQGLRSTLVQDRIGFWVDNYLQVVHSRSNHWILHSVIQSPWSYQLGQVVQR